MKTRAFLKIPYADFRSSEEWIERHWQYLLNRAADKFWEALELGKEYRIIIERKWGVELYPGFPDVQYKVLICELTYDEEAT